ncbi:unnamed protein product [Mycena citricolor]|uniref:ribonuclease T2 n=1 Tax=Mycena citricolor TaxID=2018698 RepID=A0AAD2GYA5_9AGAR|nr:unnamed protein product [Mycena citricolor]
MPPRSIPLLTASLVLIAPFAHAAFQITGNAISSSCAGTSVASCMNTTAVHDLCCFEAPGGLLLQTQFWDTNPETGPVDSWTIHGLWPDHCDLSFSESCDPSRAYKNIAGLLSAQGAQSTLDYMKTYWVDIDGQNERFWEHEWSTHGTCYSTLKPSCLPQGSPQGAEAVAFFNTVVGLFQQLPTYTWLANQGITPSSSATYDLQTLTDALQTGAGFAPVLDCRGSALDSVSWYFHLQGSLLDGTMVPVGAPEKGTCPSTGIKYVPKSLSGSHETTPRRKQQPARRRHHHRHTEDSGSVEQQQQQAQAPLQDESHHGHQHHGHGHNDEL